VKYICVQWLHSCPNDPLWLISELDEDRWEVRKVEIFPDGSKGYASRDDEVGNTFLGLAPVPPLEEIAADPEFIPSEITRAEFETIWAARQQREDRPSTR
jgi:hypothetical protein